VIASIPSPAGGTIEIGPLTLNMYGVMIALGVVAAVWLTGRRLEQAGTGTRDDASAVAIWAVSAGIIGARLWHVMTDWSSFEDNPGDIIRIWEGGLGIPGGLLFGIAVGLWATRRRGVAMSAMADAAAPAIPLAQAIGRWGNWWNQELYGRATTLPWGLEIDDEHLVAGAESGQLFHPTFLYESLWNLALCGVLLWIDKRFTLRPGRLLAVYVVGYGIGRFWVEGLRIDPADDFGPFRFNQWVALAAVVGGTAFLVIDWLRHRHDEVPDPSTHPSVPAAEGEPSDDAAPASDGEPGDGYVAADEH
jgi:prolipoprotein diacylglyceryl transferase